MDYIIELLNMAEKYGILTGGTDQDGNAAFVVIDSSSVITVTVRPGGRATVIVAGEEENFDLSDETGEGAVAFFEALSQALTEDNLDHKSAKLIDLLNEFSDSLDEEGDGEEDPEAEDTEDSEDPEEEVTDEEDVADEEDSEEEPEPKPKKMKGKKRRTMGNEDSEGGDEEASTELAHSDIVINQTLLPLGFKVTYDPAATGSASNDRYVVIATEDQSHTNFVIETPGELFVAKQGENELYNGTDAKAAALAIASCLKEEGEEEETEEEEDDMSLTDSEVAIMIEHADAIITNMVEQDGEPEVFDTQRFSDALASVGQIDGYQITIGDDQITVNTGDNEIAVTKDFMVTAAATFAKLSTNATNEVAAHKMMRLAIQLGYDSKSSATKVSKEEAALDYAVELAITQAQVRSEIKKLKVLSVKFEDGEVMLRYTKEAMPDAARRESTETPTDMEDVINTAKQMADWYERTYKPTLNR